MTRGELPEIKGVKSGLNVALLLLKFNINAALFHCRSFTILFLESFPPPFCYLFTSF